MVICLWIGKNPTPKTPSSDFQVTTLKTSLLSQLNLTEYLTNLQLNPYPNTQSDLFCSDSFPFWCMTPKYVTNQLRGSQYATSKHQSEKIVGCKVLQFIHTMKIRMMLGHKTLRCKYTTTSLRKRWTKSRTLSPVTICLNRVCSMLVQLVYRLMALETILLYV